MPKDLGKLITKMSLLDRIKRFAEERRAMLMEQLGSEKDTDTAKVQWKGYNTDGTPNVKNGSKTETADGQGYVSNPLNQNMIYDRAGSVEYTKKTDSVRSRYEKAPLQAQKPAPRKKKTAAQPPSSVTEFALAIIKKKVAVDVICIAVIDENNGRNTDSDWAAFRAAYPKRRFFLLEPASGFSGTLYVPSAFSSDPLATHQAVSTNADWYTIAGLDQEPLGAQCILFIDQSGSMTINTVINSYNSFKSKAIQRQNKIAVVDNQSEDYIAPFYIQDDYFNVPNYQSNWPQ